MTEDVKDAFGHGIRAKRSKSGAASFDIVVAENGRGRLDAAVLWDEIRYTFV
jgi:hypothetical protein